MTINSAINILSDLAEEIHGMPDEALEDGVLPDPRYAKTEAIRLAVDILTTLEANRAKAEAIITSSKICRGAIFKDCQSCPYYRDCKGGVESGHQMELDTERLLELAYLQGDTTNDQT